MKSATLILFLIISFKFVLAQKPPVEFGNKDSFDVYLLKKLTQGKTEYEPRDTLSRYIDAIIEFDQSGHIVSVSTFSVNDDSLASIVRRVILNSNGMWKNNTNKKVLASQAFYWEWTNEAAKNKVFKYETFSDGKLAKVYELKAFKLEFGRQR